MSTLSNTHSAHTAHPLHAPHAPTPRTPRTHSAHPQHPLRDPPRTHSATPTHPLRDTTHYVPMFVTRSFLKPKRKKFRNSLEVIRLFTIFANEIIMLTQMSTEAMTQKIAEYFKTQPVLKAWIFGSFARGEQTPESDIDILIQPDKFVGLFKLSGMHLELQELLNIEVDLVTVKGLMPFARESADRDKILIYERAA